MAQAGALWLVAIAVFAALNPIAGMEQRTWQMAVLTWGGIGAAAVALAGALPPALLVVWIVALCAITGKLAVALPLLAALGVYALARRGPAARVIVAVAAVNVLVIGIQAAGAWESLLRLAFPQAVYQQWNPARPWAGLTAGTGDVGCVLAMALPFLTAGRALWLLPFAGMALLSTSALSAIVAGMAGLTVAFWPRVEHYLTREWRIGFGAVGAMGAVGFLGREELVAAWTDERWLIWGTSLKRWITAAPIAGFGPGSFEVVAQTPGVKAHLWQQAHFDLLQLGYETGIIGVALALIVFAWAYRRAAAAGNRAALGGLVALAVCQFGHFPLHLASAGVVAALVIGEATHE